MASRPTNGGLKSLLNVEDWLPGVSASVGSALAALSEKPKPSTAIVMLNRSKGAKTAARVAGVAAGDVVGISRGAVHAIQGLGQGAVFTARLMNPLDPYFSPPGRAAWDQVAGAAEGGMEYGRQVARDPRKIVRDVSQKVDEGIASVDPITPHLGSSASEEFGRGFAIGMNQGELAFDLGTMATGAAGLRGLAGVKVIAKEAKVAKYMGQGFSRADAEYLAQPYPRRNMGHHFVPRKTKIPKAIGPIAVPSRLGGWKPPKYLMDSPLNVLKPRNITRGDMNELHWKVDPSFEGGGPLPSGRSWNGSELGLKEYGPLGRVWYGSPAELKLDASAPVAGGLLSYEASTTNRGRR